MQTRKPTNFIPLPLLRSDGLPVDWQISTAPVEYCEAIAQMQDRVSQIIAGNAPEQVWLLEHPPLYTSGTSARPEDLLTPDRFPVFKTGRGGQFTYHGPGQRVAYVMLDLRARQRDVRRFVANLEAWIIDTLAAFNIFAQRSPGRVGVWVKRTERGAAREEKIAAIGVRVSKWVSFHGISLNIMPDLRHYEGIVACGISDSGVTSFEDLGHLVSIPEVDMVLRKTFEARFGGTSRAH